MLKPSLVVDTVVTTLRTIPALMTMFRNKVEAFHFMPGTEDMLSKAILNMTSPSILVVWSGTRGGNFDGMTIWKHDIDIYFRTGNTAKMSPALAYEDAWHLMMNSPVNETQLNIRQLELLPAQLQLMELPSAQHMVDETGADLFVGKCVFPEVLDQPNPIP